MTVWEGGQSMLYGELPEDEWQRKEAEHYAATAKAAFVAAAIGALCLPMFTPDLRKFFDPLDSSSLRGLVGQGGLGAAMGALCAGLSTWFSFQRGYQEAWDQGRRGTVAHANLREHVPGTWKRPLGYLVLGLLLGSFCCFPVMRPSDSSNSRALILQYIVAVVLTSLASGVGGSWGYGEGQERARATASRLNRAYSSRDDEEEE